MGKQRGFEMVRDEKRVHFQEVALAGKKVKVFYDIKLPARADKRSAGYDFFLPKDVDLHPGRKVMVFLDVKAYMQDDEVLKIYPRSSLGAKGLTLTNTVGVIDASYYENAGNDGNIGLSLLNTSGITIQLKAGDRIAQGVFQKYLVTDEDNVLRESREGGFGSSGK